MTSLDKYRSIDSFDIFDLIGQSKLSTGEKNKLFDQFYQVIINKFIKKQISLIVDLKILKAIRIMIKNKNKPSDIVDLLNEKNPNFINSLADFVRFNKIDFIKRYYANLVSDLEKTLASYRQQETIIKTKNKLKFYLIAKSLAKQELWKVLLDYINKTPDFENVDSFLLPNHFIIKNIGIGDDDKGDN